MKKVLIAIMIFYCLPNLLISQVTFVASSSKVVELGENFRLNFSVNANGTDFVPPDLSSFHVLAGPSTSTSTSFQYINGKTSQAISNTYSYIIQGKKEGKYNIGKAEIKVDDKVYYSDPIVIEVIKGNASNNSESNIDNSSNEQGNNDIFIQINLDKTTVYQGEQIIATLKVYDRVGLKGINNYKFPSFTGFYSQEIKQPSQISLDRENVGGKIYQTGILRQSILYPQQSGTLTIDPFELECIVQQKAGQRRNFFGELIDVYRDVNKNLKSPSRKVKVLPLPENAPKSFTGAVGSNFQFNVVVDRSSLKSNESATLKVNISGNGNLKIIDKININFPASFEVFDPKIVNNINNTSTGSKGSNTYEYLMIPREAGEYTIPAIEFSYFDVSSKSYKTLSSKPFNFKIEKGENLLNVTTNTGINKEEVKELGSDIRFIFQDNFKVNHKDKRFFGSLSFYLFYLISLFIFILIIVILRNRIKQNKNISLIKNKRANKMSKRRLKAASDCMLKGNKQAFYDEVIKALWGYLSDKLNIPVANLSRESARESLRLRHVDDGLINEFVQVIDNCEFAKYAPAGSHNQIDKDLESARMILNKLEHEIT